MAASPPPVADDATEEQDPQAAPAPQAEPAVSVQPARDLSDEPPLPEQPDVPELHPNHPGHDFILQHGYDPTEFAPGPVRDAYAPIIKNIYDDNRNLAQEQAAEEKQQAQLAHKQANEARHTYYQQRGIKSFVNAEGNHMPVLDEDGQPVYTPKKGAVQWDEKGEAFRQSRDASGAVTTTRPDANAPVGPADNDPSNLYKQNKFSAWDNLGPLEDHLGSANPQLAQAAKDAQTARNGLLQKAADHGFKLAQDKVANDAREAELAYAPIKAQAADLEAQIAAKKADPAFKSGDWFGAQASQRKDLQDQVKQLTAQQAKLPPPPDLKTFKDKAAAVPEEKKAFDYLVEKHGGDVNAAAQEFRDQITRTGGDPDAHVAMQHLEGFKANIGMPTFDEQRNGPKAAVDAILQQHPEYADKKDQLTKAQNDYDAAVAATKQAYDATFGQTSIVGASLMVVRQAREQADQQQQAAAQKVADAGKAADAAKDKAIADSTGMLGKSWNSLKAAVRTVGSSLGHGLKGLLDTDPAAKYSGWDDTKLAARQAELQKQIGDLEKQGRMSGGWYEPEEGEGGSYAHGDPQANALQDELQNLTFARHTQYGVTNPELWKQALEAGQMHETYGTNPALENTALTKAGRIVGGIGGFVGQGAIHPALPLAMMVSSASSEARDAAEEQLKASGETDPEHLRLAGDAAATRGAAFAAATIPLYMLGGKAATEITKRLLPFASPLARAATGFAASGVANTVASAAARKMEGNDLIPTPEEAATDWAWALTHAHGEFKGTRMSKQVLDGTNKQATQLAMLATDESAPPELRDQATKALDAMQDHAAQFLTSAKARNTAQEALTARRVARAHAAIDGMDPDTDQNLQGLTPKQVEDTQNLARGLVKIASGEPLESLTTEEQAVVDTNGPDGLPRFQKVKGKLVISQGQIDRLRGLVPEAADVIRNGEEEMRQGILNPPAPVKPLKAAKESEAKASGAAPEGVGSSSGAAPHATSELKPEEAQRANLLAQHLVQNAGAAPEEAEHFAAGFVKKKGVQNYAQQRIDILGRFRNRKPANEEAQEHIAHADVAADLYHEALANMEARGEGPKSEQEHEDVRKAAAIFAPAIARHRAAFTEINFTMEKHGHGGASSEGKDKLTLSIGDILDRHNLAELEASPHRAGAIIREEAIHSLMRAEITDAEVTKLWGELPESVKGTVRAAYLDTSELKKKGLAPEHHPEWNNGMMLGHEYLRMLTEGKLDKQLSEMSSPSLLQTLGAIFKRLLAHFADLRKELAAGGTSKEAIDLIDGTTDKVAKAYKKIVADADVSGAYEEGREPSIVTAGNREAAGLAPTLGEGKAGRVEVGSETPGGAGRGESGLPVEKQMAGAGAGRGEPAEPVGNRGEDQSGDSTVSPRGGGADELRHAGGGEEAGQRRELSAEEKLRRDNQPVQVRIDDIEVSTVDEKGKKKADGPVKNFKGGVDPERGIVPGNELPGEEYEDLGKPAIVVWERKDGRRQIITGRHRLDKARRVKGADGNILAHVVKEADGFTAHDAEIFDAESNIQDDQGTSADYARYFEKSGITEERARKKGLIGREKGRVAWAVVKEGAPELRAAFINERINADQAFAIAKNAPGNEALQRLGLAEALDGRSADDAVEVMLDAKENYGTRAETLDMFGNDDRALQEARARGKVANTFKQQIRKQIKATEGAAKYPEEARKLDVDVNDPEALKGKLAELNKELERWNRWRSHPDLAEQVKAQMAEGQQVLAARRGGDPELRRLHELRAKEARGELNKYEQDELVRAEKRAGQTFIPGFDETRKADMPFTLESEDARAAREKPAGEQMRLFSRKSGVRFDPDPEKNFKLAKEYYTQKYPKPPPEKKITPEEYRHRLNAKYGEARVTAMWNDVEALKAQHEAAKPEFDAWVEGLARSTGGEAKLADLKGTPRAVEKLLQKDKPATAIKDLLRATVVVPNVKAAHQLLARISKERTFTKDQFGKDEVEDRFSMPTEAGHMDIITVLDLGNGLRGELQINLPEMMEAKDVGHPIYEIQRSMPRVLDPDQWQQYKMLRRDQAALYSAALETNQARKASGPALARNSSSETSRGGRPALVHADQSIGTALPSTKATSDMPPETGITATGSRSPSMKNSVPAGKSESALVITPSFIREKGAPVSQKLAADQVQKGGVADVPAAHLAGTLREMAAMESPVDISDKLLIDGRNVFHAGLDIDRADMPQVPSGHKPKFFEMLGQRGIEVKPGRTISDKLHPSQGEIDGVAVGQMLTRGFDVAKLEEKPIVVSADNYILDGHHRWAAYVAMALEGTVPRNLAVTRIGLPIRELLDVGREFMEANGIASRTLDDHGGYAMPLAARRGVKTDEGQGGFGFFGDDNPLTPATPERIEKEDESPSTQPGRNGKTGKRPGVGGGVAKAGGGQPDLFDFSAQPGNGGSAGEAGGAGRPGGIFGDELGGKPGHGPGGSDTGSGGADSGAAGEGDGTEPRDPATARRLARIAERRAVPPEQRNFRVERDTQLAPTGDKKKLRANIDAIKLLRTLQDEDRNATPEEKATLAQYTGWGGLSQALDSVQASKRDWIKDFHGGYEEYKSWEDKWGAHYNELKDLLSPEEFEAAKMSTENAHFTAPKVIGAMWDAIKGFGFTDGRVLEPAGGIGHFFGLMPADMADASDLFGVELDPTSAAIFQKLYPQANIQATGFERANIPDNSMDLSISNVPFSEVGPYDPAHADANLNLHNYFFAKALDKAKPGGLVAFITTQHTMDSNARQRAYIAERGQFLGAIRLPNNAFKANAGTEVVTDIVFMRKSDGRTVAEPEPWAKTQEVGREMVKFKDEDGTEKEEERPVTVNEYFARHPDMVLGRNALSGTMYRAGQYTVEPTPGELGEKLAGAIKKLPQNIAGTPDFTPEEKQYVKGDWKPGQFVEQNGKLGVNVGGVLTDLAKADERFADPKRGPALVKKVRDFMALRDTYSNLIDAMRDPKATDAEIADTQDDLRLHYDKFLNRYGNLGNGRHKILNSDPDYYAVLGLEKVKTTYGPDGKKQYAFSKADIFTKRTIQPVTVPTEAANALDAMRISQSWLGRPDVDWMAKLTGKTPEEVKSELLGAGHVFENPTSGLIEPREYYLSGNVRQKLAQARESAKNNPAFARNVEELEKVQPEPIPINDIAVKLGAGWIPPAAVDAFAHDLLGLAPRTGSAKPHFKSSYVQAGDADGWGTTHSSEAEGREENRTTFAGGGKTALDLLDLSLNLKEATVFKRISKDKSVFDPERTAAARMAQERIRQAFDAFAKSDKTVTANIDGKTETLPAFEAMARLYNATFNGHRDRTYDGSHLTLPGAAEHVMAPPNEGGLRPHQKDGIWRAVQEGTALLAHGVGTGKTNELIGIANEWRRLGTAKKPMIVVQNATLEQFAASFKRMYPGANILVGTKEDLEGPKRKAFMARVASGDWDSVIVPHSSFGLIPDDPEFEKSFVGEQMAEIENALQQRIRELAQMGKSGKEIDKDPTVKQLTKTKKRWQKKLDKVADRAKDDTLTFQQLGVDGLLVDEAHLFKKVPFYTRMERVAGLDQSSSDRAYGLWLKLRAVQDAHNGRNTVLATGTPITNTIAEAWNMLRLTNPKALKEFHVETFDRFASAFGQTTTEPEMSPAGKWKMRSRFGSYVNVPELQKMLKSTWDIKDGKDLDLGRPEVETGAPQGVAVERTEPVHRYMDYISHLYDEWEKLDGEDKMELSYIPLLIYGNGKAATLDMRLIDPTAPDDPHSKVNAMVDKALDAYHESTDRRGTQLIFADTYGQRDTAKLDAFANGEKPDFSDLQEKQQTEGEDDTSEPEDDGEETAPGKFNLYHDIREKLIARGVPAQEIAIMDEAKKAAQRESLFNRVKEGAVRFLIGSTQKMGTGVNVQDRVYALHNLDAPWTPADLEQRNGRAWRAGNMHAELGIPIKILNYGMKQTIDAGLFQLIETKARFTNEALTTSARTVSDIGGSPADNAAMLKALFSGDERAIQRVKLENVVRRLSMEAGGWKMEKDKARSGIYWARENLRRLTDGYDTSATSTGNAEHIPGLGEMRTKAQALTAAMQAPGLRFTVGDEAATAKSNSEKDTATTINKCVSLAEPMLLQNAKTLNEPLILLRGKVRGLDYEIRGRGQMVMAHDKEGNPIRKPTGNSVVENGKIVPETREVMEPAARYEALYKLGNSVLRQKGITSNSGPAFIEGTKGLETYYDGRIRDMERDQADLQARITEMQKGVDEPYPKLAELADAQRELDQVNDELLHGPKEPAPPEKDAETMQMEDDGAQPLYSRRGVLPEDSDQLGFDFQSGVTGADRIRNNIGFVDKMARRFSNIPGVQYEDVRSQARAALVKAANTYTPDKGAFQNYAGRVTRNALIDLWRKENQYRGHEKQTLNEPEPGGDTERPDRIEGAADPTQDTARTAGNREGAEVLNNAVEALPDRLRNVVRGLMAGDTLEAIGERSGIGRQAVHNQAKIAYTRLRQKLGELGLKAPDDVMALNARRGVRPPDEGFDPYEAMGALQRLAGVEKPGARTIGRPDLALGAEHPGMMGVDEFRKGIVKPETVEGWTKSADEMLTDDREGVRSRIMERGLAGATLSPEETIAAKKIVAEEMKHAFGAGGTEAMRRDASLLFNAYRETGRTAGQDLAARFDPTMKPEDRAREFLGKMIFTPPPDVQAKIDKAPDAATRKKLLGEDQERVTRIEKELAKMGVSLDDIMNGEVTLRLKSAKFIANTTKDFASKEREAIRMLQANRSREEIAKHTGLTVPQIEGAEKKLFDAFLQKHLGKFKAGATADNVDLEALAARPLHARGVSEAEALAEAHKAFKMMGFGRGDAQGKKKTFDIKNPAHVVKVARTIQAAGSNALDMAHEFWINSILSGPKTHVAIFTGVAARATFDFTIGRGAEAFVNSALKLFGKHDPNGAQWGEFGHILRGIVPGLATAWRAGVEAFDAEASMFKYKHDPSMRLEDIDAGASKDKRRVAIPGQTGRVIRVPGRGITFADEFFKTLMGRMQVGAEAYRRAKAAGMEGDAMGEHIKAQLADPYSEAWQSAAKLGTDWMLQNELRSWKQGAGLLEGAGSAFINATNHGYGRLLRFQLPFVRLPYNIVATGVRKSPLGALNIVKKFAKEGLYRIQNGEMNPAGYARGEFIRDAAEQAIAWGAMGLLWGAAQGDPDDKDKGLLITGSDKPGDNRKPEAQLAKRLGIPSFSIRTGGKTFNYGRIEPYATVIGTTVDAIKEIKAMQNGEQQSAAIGNMLMHLVGQFSDKAYGRGMDEMMKALTDTDHWATNAGSAFLASWVPNLIRQPMRNFNPYEQETTVEASGKEWVNQFMEKTRAKAFPSPNSLPQKIDAYGQPVESGGGLFNVLAPVFQRNVPEIHQADELLANWNREHDAEKWAPATLHRTYQVGHETHTMSNDEFHDFSEDAGRRVVAALRGKLTQAQIDNPKEADVDTIRKAFEKAHKDAREVVKQKAGIPTKRGGSKTDLRQFMFQ